MQSRLKLVCGFASLILCGCGGDTLSAPDTASVNGAVLLKGAPAIGVRVKLHPQFDIGEIKFVPSGETGPDGRFTISTAAPGDGAPPGDYAVTLEKPQIVSDRNQSGIEVEVDEFQGKYSNAEQSRWNITIVDGTNQLEPFELTE